MMRSPKLLKFVCFALQSVLILCKTVDEANVDIAEEYDSEYGADYGEEDNGRSASAIFRDARGQHSAGKCDVV